jgi:hypothetical protein
MTAVEFLIQEIEKTDWWLIRKKIPLLIEQAKEIEKQQIINAYHNGYSDAIQAKPKQYDPQKYYNETYKSEKL